MNSIIITRPDDWHVHLRDGDYLIHTVQASANHFGRALVMPNLNPPINSLAKILEYHQRIIAVQANNFTPLMTFYLNEALNTDDLIACKQYPYIVGAKLYPAGATTNSAAGAKDLTALYPFFAVMQEQNLVLQIHGELAAGDIFHREQLFIEQNLKPIIANFPKLRIVLEHISTKAAVDFISNASKNVAATITPHHLLYNRNQLLAGGLRPHYYCLPILKKQSDQLALQQAATSGNPKFFAGTDSAPHAKANKESACGCAGIYSAPFALSFYTQVFAEHNKLQFLNNFLSHFGANFYQFPPNHQQIEIQAKNLLVPERLSFGPDWVIPMGAGQTLQWRVNESI